MATLSLAMIVKNERRTLPRVLEFAQTICEEMVIVDTGSTDGTQEIVQRAGAKLFHFDWVEDFAAARNYAFAQCTQEWILWLDADDMLSPQSLDAIRALKQTELQDPRVDSVFTSYHYEYTPAGEVSVILNRERFLRRSAGHKWVGRIHEVIPSAWTKSINTRNVVVEHRPHQDDLPRKNGRNLRNYEAWINIDTSDLRDVFLYGSELLWNGRSQDAIPVLEKYLSRFRGADVIGERYMVLIKLADSLMVQNRREEATVRCLQAIAANPTRAEGYCLAGLNFVHQGQWENAWPMLVAAAACGVPSIQSGLVVHKFYGETPRIELKRCMEKLHQPQRAAVLAELAIMLGAPVAVPAPAPAPVPIPIPVAPADVVQLLPDVAPAANGADVRIYLGSTALSPETVQNRGTAAENAVVDLARAWALQGCRVQVYGAVEGSWDGVHYKLADTYDPQDPCDVLVLWRSLEPVKTARPAAGSVIVWAQDGSLGAHVSAEMLERIDRVATWSRFQASVLKGRHPQAGDKLWFVGTSIDVARYEGTAEKIAGRYFYAGHPRAGLQLLLEQWPKVRELHPHAELHVASEFDLALQEALRQGPAASMAMRDLLRLMQNTPGVVSHVRLNQDQLAALQKTCVAWLSPPTDFTEAGGSTALEAQAALCIPITHLSGALPEALRHALPWDRSASLVDLVTLAQSSFGPDRLHDNREFALAQSWTAQAHRWLHDLVKPRPAAA